MKQTQSSTKGGASSTHTQVPTVLETVSIGRTPEERPVKVRIHAPGARGTLQTVAKLKKDANALLPKFTRNHEMATPLLTSLKEQRHAKRKLTKSLEKLKVYTDRLFVDGPTMSEETHYKTLRSMATVIDRATTANAQDNGEGVYKEGEKLREAAATLNASAREFGEALKRIESVAESWKDVGWTTNNPTAVGRGPPGHIAYSPFAQYRMPYEATDVRKVTEDANRRLR